MVHNNDNSEDESAPDHFVDPEKETIETITDLANKIMGRHRKELLNASSWAAFWHAAFETHQSHPENVNMEDRNLEEEWRNRLLTNNIENTYYQMAILSELKKLNKNMSVLFKPKLTGINDVKHDKRKKGGSKV